MAEDFPIVFALFPRITQLDFTAPLEVLARLPGARVTLASIEGGTLGADGGVVFAAVRPLAQVRTCALLCVPGGFGTTAAMQDAAYLEALRRLAAQARYVTSVCTGSLLLGAAGLLRGVRDGNLITGGGVTPGIDMALTVVAEIAGRDFAEGVQLAIEYAPEPPFDSGRPERARAAVLAAVRARIEALAPERREVAERVGAALAGAHAASR